MVTRRNWLEMMLAGLAIAGPLGCGSKKETSAKKSDDDSDEEDDSDKKKNKKKKKKKKADEDDSDEKADKKPDAPKSAEPPKTAAGKPDLPKILGPKGTWVPPAFSKLKFAMTPDDAGKVIPGAEKISEFGFSNVTVTDTPGVSKYGFYFAKKGGKPIELQSVKMMFDPALSGDDFWATLKKECIAKYGPTDEKEKILTWIGPGFTPAQLTQGLSDEGYTLDVTLPH